MSIEVYIDWKGESLFVGKLHTSERTPATSFEYSSEWLARPNAFPIDPTSLPLRAGPHHASMLFGAFADCGPDRWGRLLIKRSASKGILERMPRHDLDYALALDDASRIGALRFRAEAGGPFLGESSGKLPPIVQLTALLNAANAVHGESETAEDLRCLLGRGSPLGGARPKSCVTLRDGSLAIAKFPKPDDILDVAAGEVLALTLARKAGMTVAEHQFLSVDGKSISVITRFDRQGEHRIPFLSANTLLALPQDDPGAYTLLADGIRQYGDDVQKDLRELWRRLVFSLLASNYDDHLRNHGFLMLRAGRWALSPAYDLNPVPEIDRPQTPKTPISEDAGDPTIAAALRSASRFALTELDAKTILREVFEAVSTWRETGKRLGIKASTLASYQTAFEHPMAEEARRIIGC